MTRVRKARDGEMVPLIHFITDRICEREGISKPMRYREFVSCDIDVLQAWAAEYAGHPDYRAEAWRL